MIRRHFLGGMAATAGTIAGGAAGLARGDEPAVKPRSGPFKIGIMMHEKEDRPIDQTDPGYDLIEIPVKILVLPLGHQQQWDETLGFTADSFVRRPTFLANRRWIKRFGSA